MIKSIVLFVFAAFVFGCAEPAAIDVTDPIVHESSLTGGSACTLGTTCTIGLSVYECATDVATSMPVCCSSGCYDSADLCWPGTWGTECGAHGAPCSTCAAGRSCSSGACVSSCGRSEGNACSTRNGPGKYGNGYGGTCVCCDTCFDPDSGVCVISDDNDCGTGGGKCQRCVVGYPYCVAGKCSSSP